MENPRQNGVLGKPSGRVHALEYAQWTGSGVACCITSFKADDSSACDEICG
jgi:hypothetical protein